MTFKDIKASWPYSERLEKRISCEKCGALFDTKKARREHIIAAHPFAASHFSCSLCQKSFRGLKGLKSHQQNVDCQKSKRQARSQSEKTSDFKCDKCPVMCTSKKSLKVNINSVVEFQRYTQSPIIKNGPIKNGAEIFGKFKEQTLSRSKLRNA